MTKVLLILLVSLMLALLLIAWRLDAVTTQRDTARANVVTSQTLVDSLRPTLRLSHELLADRDALDIQFSQELMLFALASAGCQSRPAAQLCEPLAIPAPPAWMM